MNAFDFQILFNRDALRFLQKNRHLYSQEQVNEWVIEAVLSILNGEPCALDLKELKDNWAGHYRIRKGKTRIIFNYTEQDDEIVIEIQVIKIGFRKDVY